MHSRNVCESFFWLFQAWSWFALFTLLTGKSEWSNFDGLRPYVTDAFIKTLWPPSFIRRAAFGVPTDGRKLKPKYINMNTKEYHTNKESLAYNLGVIGVYYQDGGIHLELRGGGYVHEKTPSDLTSEQHLRVLLNKLQNREL